MLTFALCAAAWVGCGLLFYHIARTSWNKRWGDNSAPLTYGLGALFGPACLGFCLCELILWTEGR